MSVEILLLVWIIGWLIYELANQNKDKTRLLAGQTTKLKIYKSTILTLWLPTILLLIHLATGGISMTQLGLVHSWQLTTFIGWLGCLVILSYFVFSLHSIQQNQSQHPKLRAQFEPIAWIMPSTKVERNWFIFGTSLTAGICEELLFRGFLLHVLGQSLGTLPALFISSLVFGLFHFYQGWQGIVKTGLFGLILALIYLWTGSLWVVIALHFVWDAYAGQLFYLVEKSAKE
ncbi:CPBP family intramembrane glutamic endopeptidase [Pseudoalteromonas sp. T1lg65]|uniref:CPBP family intramembrane glutamic endopeptidase n=1 Tax=Pseudoalteromonas sp. T1lg65 TaxID=2077101 RepID=UPI003F7921E8